MPTRRQFLRTAAAIPAIAGAMHLSNTVAQAASGTKRNVLFENFATLDRWYEITSPARLASRQPMSLASDIGGRTSSCLKLTGIDPVSFAPGTVVALNDFVFSNGIIELDAYLSQPALLDVMFRTDINAVKGYVARLESRGSPYFDAFVDIEPWVAVASASTITSLNQWVRMRITAKDNKVTIHKNGVKVLSYENAVSSASGSIGLLTEGGSIYVDNLRITTFD
jgi:hypothetical protein